jgi:hypothetical protein
MMFSTFGSASRVLKEVGESCVVQTGAGEEGAEHRTDRTWVREGGAQKPTIPAAEMVGADPVIRFSTACCRGEVRS